MGNHNLRRSARTWAKIKFQDGNFKLKGGLLIFDSFVLVGRNNHAVEPELSCVLKMIKSISLPRLTDRALLDRLEKIVALVVHEDEGGEILHCDFPDSFHS